MAILLLRWAERKGWLVRRTKTLGALLYPSGLQGNEPGFPFGPPYQHAYTSEAFPSEPNCFLLPHLPALETAKPSS
jgi:hypothetical protein